MKKSTAMRSAIITTSIFGVAVALLFVLSVLRSYSLGQHLTMYDNPTYRWRESMAIALSRLQLKPSSGYLAYRSISNYLNQNGLALSEDEAHALPTAQQRHDLVYDHARIEALIRDAAAVPVDDTLPPVTLNGNEKGLADFYVFAFRIFGIHTDSLVKFYYLILGLSVALFFVTFRKSPFCMLMLLLYLCAHFYMVGFASHPYFSTIHNSRFFPVPALLPSMHLLLLLLRNTPLTAGALIVAGAQTTILFFVVLCRIQTMWQVAALLASPLLVFGHRGLWIRLRHPRLTAPLLRRDIARIWPAMLVAAGLAGYMSYTKIAFDRIWYHSETTTHLFWHPLFAGMVSASPQLSRIYNVEEAELYSDNFVYQAVLTDLRRRNEIPPTIGFVNNGQIMINLNWDSGAYDRLARRVFLQAVREHPLLAVKAFTFDKIVDQAVIFYHGGIYRLRPFLLMLLPAIASAFVALLAGAVRPDRTQVKAAVPAILFIAAFSSIPTAIVPSILIADTILFYFMLIMFSLVFIPIATMMSPDRADIISVVKNRMYRPEP